MTRTIILGIDPGSVKTGYGVIAVQGQRHTHLDHGFVPVRGDSWGERLGCIFRQLRAVIAEHRPGEVAVEEVFMSKNAMSALKLGQARGAAICAAADADLPVSEYATRRVKQSIVGSGGASKEQVQHMVGVLLGLQQALQADAADALAVALCHAHWRSSPLAQLS